MHISVCKSLFISILLTFILALNVLAQQVQAQIVKKVEITDQVLINVIKNYIDDCMQNNAFYGSKGIIRLSVKSSNTKTRYSLSLHIDDRYKDDPPSQFGYVIHLIPYLVLIYSEDEQRRITKDKDIDLELLTNEIGDRVYQRPQKKQRWTLCRDRETGKVDWGYCIQEVFPDGNFNSVVYVVQPDGTYEKLRGL